jgi:hypothetical protein
MKPSQNSLFKADTSVRSVAESGILGLVHTNLAMNSNIKKTIGVHHSLAECQTCGKQWADMNNAQAVGAKHAKHYGHLVTVDVGITIKYNGR